MSDDVIQERLARIEEKLDRLTALEARLERFFDPLDSLMDLKRDLSLVVAPGVRLLTEELAEVETGFQLDDIFYLFKRFLLSLRHLAWGLEQLENLVDFWQDMEPLLRIAVPHLIDRLEELEQQGIFKGYQAMLQGYAKIARTYTPEDIDAIADGIVRMHGVAKKFADPRFIAFVEKFMEVPTEVDLAAATPAGPFGLLWRLRSAEARQGLGVLAELTRALGRLKAANNGQAAKD
jgi:uncharacterized protein YjgD (DUF1641 family)